MAATCSAVNDQYCIATGIDIIYCIIHTVCSTTVVVHVEVNQFNV